jgi:NAD(P)H-dependent FMN reductase
MSDIKVVALVGSLRADSINRKLAEALQAQAPAGVTVEIVEGLANVPFYNEDIDGDAAPATVVALRDQVTNADRVLFVAPEYNGSTPAVLANAVDWLSRPFGAGAIKDKQVAVVGTAVGQYGGQWSHADTRKIVGVAGGKVVDGVELSHAYAWGSDPSQEAEIVAKFSDALAKLVAADEVPVPA